MDCKELRDRIYGPVSLVDWSRFGRTPPLPDYDLTALELALELLDWLVHPDLKDPSHLVKGSMSNIHCM